MAIDELDSDYICLKNASFFAWGGVGYSGELPEEIHAIRRIFEKGNAIDYLNKLEADATNEGKLYALCGLYYLDNTNYEYLMEKYSATKETATIISGCILTEDYPISQCIEDFKTGFIPYLLLGDVSELLAYPSFD